MLEVTKVLSILLLFKVGIIDYNKNDRFDEWSMVRLVIIAVVSLFIINLWEKENHINLLENII